ncbi:hypothetical protein KJ780_02145, partial [Candidatus Micrarchaeota archaeon]|nr:hypothetical protein [Candidatus Micrarchaeota archaeon]
VKKIFMDLTLAEFIGIFIGDGSLYIRKEKCSYEFKFTGNLKDEIPFYSLYVAKLASSILNRKIKPKNLDSGRSIGIYFCSKVLAEYLISMGFKSGSKSAVVIIPNFIYNNKGLALACIRGIFDTDGCFMLKKQGKYPVIAFGMKSKRLIQQLKTILYKLNIRCCTCFDVTSFDNRTNKFYTKNFLWINGKNNVAKWFDLVGSNNPKTIQNYENYLEKEKGCKK